MSLACLYQSPRYQNSRSCLWGCRARLLLGVLVFLLVVPATKGEKEGLSCSEISLKQEPQYSSNIFTSTIIAKSACIYRNSTSTGTQCTSKICTGYAINKWYIIPHLNDGKYCSTIVCFAKETMALRSVAAWRTIRRWLTCRAESNKDDSHVATIDLQEGRNFLAKLNGTWTFLPWTSEAMDEEAWRNIKHEKNCSSWFNSYVLQFTPLSEIVLVIF